IEYLAHRGHAGNICILKGDVKGAFRHLMTAAAQVFRMAAYIEELGILIIDLAAPFGWSGSPPYYSLFGRAITWRMGTNSPASVSNSNDSERFFPYEWVDDHILVEPDVGDRLQVAEATLRHAMLAVLGPRSINEAKFSSWSSDLTALGLRWNTVDRSVSIPADKIEKAHSRVRAMLEKGAASKSEFYKLLGSLRHRLQCQCTSAPRFGKVKLSEGSVADLLWFEQILNHGCLAELPLDMFGDTFSPHVELYMNASNIGAAVLDPASDEFIQVKFDNDELRMINIPQAMGPEFSINVREHLCIALAVWTWGPKWSRQSKGQMLYIKCWSDNTSAVVWCNKLRSGNVFSQELNRCIGLAEAYFNLRVSAAHIPGSINSMADAASRAWAEPYHSRWTNFSSCWKQAQVPVTCRKLYTGFSSNFSPARWPRHQHQNTAEHGRSGAHGVSGLISHDGCPRALDNTHTNSPYLPSQGSDVKPYAIQRTDVKFVNNEEKEVENLRQVTAVVIYFRGSKADQFGEGATRRLERSGTQWCCPVLAPRYLVEHHKSFGAKEDSLLCKVDVNTNLQVGEVVRALKSAAECAGQNPDSYGSHSLRSGGATALFNAGYDSLAVKRFGRWRSDAVERYTRIGDRLTARMAAEMVAKCASKRTEGVSSTPLPGNGGTSMQTL
ncbi:hypothetical protein F442_03065, partial [Phytophthora nicotianae P10297]